VSGGGERASAAVVSKAFSICHFPLAISHLSFICVSDLFSLLVLAALPRPSAVRLRLTEARRFQSGLRPHVKNGDAAAEETLQYR